MGSGDSLTIFLVDPISYSGMAYTDAAQILALESLGATATLAGSDDWMLEPGLVRHRPIFRHTSGQRARIRKGLAYLLSLVRLIRAVRAARPDIVHWQYTELPIADLAAVTAMRILGFPQVYTAHELLPWTSRRYHRAVFRALYRSMAAIIVHDGARRDELIARFSVNRSLVHVIPLGDYSPFVAPDLPQALARQALGLPLDVPVALFFGAMRPAKGLDILLEAWPRVTRELPAAMLVVAGKPYKGLNIESIASRNRGDWPSRDRRDRVPTSESGRDQPLLPGCRRRGAALSRDRNQRGSPVCVQLGPGGGRHSGRRTHDPRDSRRDGPTRRSWRRRPPGGRAHRDPRGPGPIRADGRACCRVCGATVQLERHRAGHARPLPSAASVK